MRAIVPFYTIKYPLIWLTFFLIIGIIIGKYIDLSFFLVSNILIFSVLILCSMHLWSYRNETQKLIFHILLYFTFICFGIFQFQFTKPIHTKLHYFNFKSNELNSIQATIQYELKSNPYQQQYLAEITQINNKKRLGSLLLKIPKSEIEVSYKTGDILLFPGVIVPIPNAKNPFQFDYSKYQESKGVFGQVTVNDKLILKLGVDKGINYYFGLIRNYIQAEFEKAPFSENNRGVLLALLIGNRQFINNQTSEDFAKAGAIHVLAISGLHIGILLFFFNIFLKPLGQEKKNRIIKLILQLSFLWSFAILAGMSASVVRAVTMFSFMSIGYQMLRGTNIYNTLAASILILLIIKPNFLFDVGFQMSYIAVLGIVSLQPYFQRLWHSKNRFIQYFYELITVSIAAQVALLPLCLFYFHQFPGLFLLTNLFVIPLITLALLCGLICIFFILFMPIPYFLANFINIFLTWLVDFISWVASQDDFIFSEIPFHLTWVFILGLFFLSGFLWVIKKQKKMIFGVFTAILLFQFSWIYLYFLNPKTELVVFHIFKKNQILVNQNGKIRIYQNNVLEPNNKIISQYKTGSFSEIIAKNKIPNTILFQNYSILIVDSMGVIPQEKFTHWIMMKSPRVNLERFLNINAPKMIIADGSNMPYLIKKWEKTCKSKNIPFHATSEKGAYILK